VLGTPEELDAIANESEGVPTADRERGEHGQHDLRCRDP
jgi:hypothetical protein